jgi:coiled-coil domain-containing protein 40
MKHRIESQAHHIDGWDVVVSVTCMQVHEKELKVVMMQNEVAKLTVDILNTEAHNLQLEDTLKLLDEELAEKAKVIDKYQLEIQRRNDDIEKKTRSVDTLNRKLEKLIYDMEGEDTGWPLENYQLSHVFCNLKE